MNHYFQCFFFLILTSYNQIIRISYNFRQKFIHSNFVQISNVHQFLYEEVCLGIINVKLELLLFKQLFHVGANSRENNNKLLRSSDRNMWAMVFVLLSPLRASSRDFFPRPDYIINITIIYESRVLHEHQTHNRKLLSAYNYL